MKPILVLPKISDLPAYKGVKEKQQQLVSENPFIKIEDWKTLKIAKERRTALKSGRVQLQKDEKLIASELASFRNLIKTETETLILITKEAEDKQQFEIDEFEAAKQREKEEAERKRLHEIEKIKTEILSFKNIYESRINDATLVTIAEVLEDIENNIFDAGDLQINYDLTKEELISKCNERLEALKKEEKNRQLMIALEKQKEEQRKKEAELKAKEAEIKRKEAEREAKIKAREEALKAKERAIEEAERKAIEAKELKAKEEAEKAKKQRQEALAPDKEKLFRFITSFKSEINLKEINLKDEEARGIALTFLEKTEELKKVFLQLTENL